MTVIPVDGPASDMVISGGVNIDPAEYERALIGHPAVTAAAVFGDETTRWASVSLEAPARTRKAKRLS